MQSVEAATVRVVKLYNDGALLSPATVTEFLSEVDRRLICGEASAALAGKLPGIKGVPVVQQVFYRNAPGERVTEVVARLANREEPFVARLKAGRRYTLFTASDLNELLAMLPDDRFSEIADSALGRTRR